MGLLFTYVYLAIHSPLLWAFAAVLWMYYMWMKRCIKYYDTNMLRTDDKVFIITGAESGIGRQTADLLAARGGRIIMACKDMALAAVARDEIVKRTMNEKVETLHLDLASLESVRKFAKEIHDSVDKLDVLVNNAAITCATNPTTPDGLNTIMQVNHFGPFLLTNLLLDLLKKAAPSRIVFVSTVHHHMNKFCLENLNNDKEPLSNCRLYLNSKLANIITAKHFARMLQGSGVTSNSLHPGFTKTKLTDSCSETLTGKLFNLWLSIFGMTPHQAAMTPAFVASEASLTYVTGEHFANCKISKCVSSMANDTILQERLFEKSAELVKLKSEERLL